MKWKYIKPLTDVDLISEVEGNIGYHFPEAFKMVVIKNNGGRPEKCVFDTNKTNKRVFMTLLSFNRGDKNSVWPYLIPSDNFHPSYVPFGIDDTGNLICFRINDNKVIFVNLDNLDIELIADDFDSFIKLLC